MKRLKLKDKYYKIIDGFDVNESSREVKYSNVKIDFTKKGIADLPLKYQECQLIDGDIEEKKASEGETIEGSSLNIDYDEDRNYEYNFKGQTTQDGTPTPDSPVPINITTGRQVVSVCGKNLLNMFVSHNAGYSTTIRGITFTLNENGSITINGTNDNTGVSDFYVYGSWGATTTQLTTTENCTFSTSSTITNGNINAFIISGSTAVRTLQSTNASGSVPANTNITALLIRVLKGQTINNITLNLQLEKGNTPSTYEEYKGNDYEINLGKNLLNIDGTRTSEGLTNTTSGTIISVSGTSTNTYSSSTQQITQNIPIGTYTFSIQETYSKRIGFIATFSDNTNTTYNITANQLSTTFTTTKEIKSYRLYMETTSGTTYNMTIKPQLEKGSVASSFSPYKTPIYLGKIGTYQDYIFKNTTENPLYDSNLEEGQWYIHKEIGKRVLKGNESNWMTQQQTGFYRYGLNVSEAINDSSLSNEVIIKSDYFRGITFNSRNSDLNETIYLVTNNAQHQFFINTHTYSTIDSFKTWLGTHNVEVYYVLNTPTNTLIEDEELINQLNSIELLSGTNNIFITSTNLPLIMNLHYNYNEDIEIVTENEVIYTGYVNNYTLPKMKNKLEYRELDIDLLSPLALATLRTADAIGTYNLQTLIREIIQPLIDDGFTLKELNVGNNQISVNYLTETVESALNKLSNKFNFWWFIDKNKNIYINDIKYIFNKKEKAIYDDDNKINGLIDFTPSMESVDYFNTIDFTNVRLVTKSHYQKDQTTTSGMTNISYLTYNPLISKDYINPGDEIEFEIPFIINTDKRGYSNTGANVEQGYFRLYKIVSEGTIDEVVSLIPDINNEVIIPSNATITDNYNEDKEFVFVKDSFFDNLIVGMKYNGSNKINVGLMVSDTALMWTKVRINDNREIEFNKDIISTSGIVEKQIDMNEQWLTYEELLEISNSLIGNNNVNVEKVEILTDVENNYNVGDIISINKPSFLTYGDFIITDKKRSYYDNVDQWTFTLNNTNILESYIDLFRSGEQEEQSNKVYNLITGDYAREIIAEKYEVEVL